MDLRTRALKIVSQIPQGRVMSYGQVASLCGQPRAARAVGGVLRGLPADAQVPWWRVINARGEISVKGNWFATKDLQKRLLEKEGVKVSSDLRVDMVKYQASSTK